MFETVYLLVFLFLYFIIVFIIPSLRVKRNTGKNVYVFKNTDSAHDFLGKVSMPVTILIFLVAIVNAFFPQWLCYLAPFSWLELYAVKIAGFVLIHTVLIWIIIAQAQMNNSWRVGIDKSEKTELKTKGLFSVSRNPVFLGMSITLFGIFLIIPDAITLMVLVSSFLMFQVQVRLEEEYLYKTHGDSFVAYATTVRRWL